MVVFVRKAWLVFFCCFLVLCLFFALVLFPLLFFLLFLFHFGFFLCSLVALRFLLQWRDEETPPPRDKGTNTGGPVGSHPWFAVISLPVAVACTVLVRPPSPEYAKNSVPPFLQLVHHYHLFDLFNPPKERRRKGPLRPGTLKLWSQPTSVLFYWGGERAFFAWSFLLCYPFKDVLLSGFHFSVGRNWMEIFSKQLTVVAMYPCYSVRCHKDAAGRGPVLGVWGWEMGGGLPCSPPLRCSSFLSISISAPCISYSVKYDLPGLTLVRIIESIVSCFSVFSYLVVWF